MMGHKTRKTSLYTLALSAGLFGFFTPVAGQQQQIDRKIGFLSALARNAPIAVKVASTFRQRLQELKWIEGQNVSIEYRYAEGKYEQVSTLAVDLVRLNLDLIYANSGVAGLAAKRSSSTVPIVFDMLGDPVSSGIVNSLARPGGNVTGVSGLGPELSTKQLELLKEILPQLRVAVMVNPSNRISAATIQETERAGRSLDVKIKVFPLAGLSDLPSTVAAMKAQRFNAVIVVADPMFGSHKQQILSAVEKHQLPAIYYESDWPPHGGLMTYAPSLFDQVRKAATLVDKVLRGAKPADLPIEQPTKFEFIINLKAANKIGLTIPPNVLARADKVIR